MTMKYKTIAYDSAKHILAMPDHYVSIARKATKATEAGGMVVKEGDRLLLKRVLFIRLMTIKRLVLYCKIMM